MSDPERRPVDPGAPGAAPADDESFLRRWSRRKHEAQQAQAPEPVELSAAEPEPPPAPAKVLTDADMPPLESLDENSDYSPFMSPGVSEELRRKALRRLFLSPAINQRCPLDSEWFDGDGSVPLGDTITHEMREEMERAARKLAESARRALDDAGAPGPDEAAAAPGAYGDLPAPGRAQPASTPADAPPRPDDVPRKNPT